MNAGSEALLVTLTTGILGYVSQNKQQKNLYIYIFRIIKASLGETLLLTIPLLSKFFFSLKT